jgi:stage II sporulation protein M
MNSSWENRQWWVWLLCVVLMGGGYLTGITSPGRFAQLLTPSLQQLQKIASKTNAFHSVFRTVGVIFIHNLFAAIVVMVLSGILTAGIYPAWSMWMNGLTMGYVVSMFAAHVGAAPWRIFVFGMLPHGVFELPAFIWCGVIGIHLGYVAIYALWHNLKAKIFHLSVPQLRVEHSFRIQFFRALKLLPYPIGLLLIAATIEGTVTPHLIQVGIPNIH